MLLFFFVGGGGLFAKFNIHIALVGRLLSFWEGNFSGASC